MTRQPRARLAGPRAGRRGRPGASLSEQGAGEHRRTGPGRDAVKQTRSAAGPGEPGAGVSHTGVQNGGRGRLLAAAGAHIQSELGRPVRSPSGGLRALR